MYSQKEVLIHRPLKMSARYLMSLALLHHHVSVFITFSLLTNYGRKKKMLIVSLYAFSCVFQDKTSLFQPVFPIIHSNFRILIIYANFQIILAAAIVTSLRLQFTFLWYSLFFPILWVTLMGRSIKPDGEFSTLQRNFQYD